MKRSNLSLLAVLVVLVVAAAVSAMSKPATGTTTVASHPRTEPVQRSSLVCPEVSQLEKQSTSYAALAPQPTEGSTATSGSATFTDVGVKKPKKRGSLSSLGTPVTFKAGKGSTVNPVRGQADGRYAPGFSAQEITQVTSGSGAQLSGAQCTQATASSWFAGASTASGFDDYLYLTNSESATAIISVSLYDSSGTVKTTGGTDLSIAPGKTLPILLSSLTTAKLKNLVVQVEAQSGRVAAALHESWQGKGGDWLPATATPVSSAVMPGLSGDLKHLQLTLYAPGDNDADLKIQLSTPSGLITPAGHESVHVKSGQVESVDLGAVTRGEASALRLTPSDPKQATPVVVGVRETRGTGVNTEVAYLGPTAAISTLGVSAANTPGESTVYLTALDATTTVDVTTMPVGGGPAATTKVNVTKGETTKVTPAKPSGKGAKADFAVVVRPESGTVYAARQLGLKGHKSLFTTQAIPESHGTVRLADARRDLSVVQ